MQNSKIKSANKNSKVKQKTFKFLFFEFKDIAS